MSAMMNTLRTVLYALLVMLVVMLYQTWTKDHPVEPNTAAANASASEKTSSSLVPETLEQNVLQANAGVQTPESVHHPLLPVEVTTDVLKVTIDPKGGNITGVTLLKFADKLHSDDKVQLMNNSSQARYLAQSGLLSQSGPDTSAGQAVWKADQTNYSLSPDENALTVQLHYQNAAGVTFTKLFTFKRNDYEIGVAYEVHNGSGQVWHGNPWLRLSRKNAPPETHHALSGFATYFGAAISTPDKAYQKVSFSDMNKAPLSLSAANGWMAMVQHYFVGAWVPAPGSQWQYFSQVSSDQMYTIGGLGPALTAEPGQTVTTSAKFYAGPAIGDQLEKVAPHLQLTIDYGWLWMISMAIFWLMQKIHSVTGNWGWSIVLVTLLIKLGFYHLSAKSYRSMSAMRRLQPKITALRERYGEDRQKLTQATLELYRTEKVNPMSGCLPVLVQIPVFISLYWVLVESIQLRHAPFILWIHDLSASDPFYILPVLMGISMFVQQRLSPAPPDPTQAKIMMLMPVVFTIMFANFPAGLMLYWFVNNSLSCLQQWYVMRTADVAKPGKGKKRR